MPAITTRVRNIGRLQGKIKKLPLDIQAATIMGLRDIALPMEEDVKRSIRTGARTGKIVKRYHPARVVQTSAPGEPPADDRGMLANSIEVDVDPTQFNLTLSAGAPYAHELEYGTRHMLPRPFLRPALTRWRERIIASIHRAIKGSL